MIPDTKPQAIVALLALGMALAFIAADRDSPTSRAMAAFLASTGFAIGLGSQVALPYHLEHGVQWWSGVFAIPETLAFVFALEWILRVRQTVPAANLKTRFADNQLRVGQALALLYLALSLAFPEVRRDHFLNVNLADTAAPSAEFLMFFAPLVIALGLGIASGLIMLRRKPDRAEVIRLVAFAISTPFMAASMILPLQFAPLSAAFGLVLFMVGAVQYHVIQGQRAGFMARFLAPQVAELVRRQGLGAATEERTLELSVVCCDLRGFTAFSAATASGQVIRILREYYDAVGEAARAVGGTIKDQAGDGVLILIGAPLAFDDHAARALDLARRIRAAGLALAERWSGGGLSLGVGIGAASGFVTVGVIGAASRLEYTAVGPAVNLAARLCSEAAHGQVLVGERTRELLAAGGAAAPLRAGTALALKGFAEPVPSWSLEAG